MFTYRWGLLSILNHINLLVDCRPSTKSEKGIVLGVANGVGNAEREQVVQIIYAESADHYGYSMLLLMLTWVPTTRRDIYNAELPRCRVPRTEVVHLVEECQRVGP